MPYSIGWYIENEIVYTYYYGDVTVDELRESLLELRDYTESSPRQLVHAITDVGDVVNPVSPKDSLELIREVGQHERTGWNIILREQSLLIKIGVAFGTSFLKTRTRTFKTLEDVQDFLREKDETINWDQVELLDWIRTTDQ